MAFKIHPNQTGFIKVRNSANNTRRLKNVTDYCLINKLETHTLVSLDAEKAVDQVNWKMLLAFLNKFELYFILH